MARDKITVDLMLATKQAEREIARINRKLGDMGKTMGKAFGGTGAGGDKVRALGSGLSKATVKADEFSKSMEASNARVIAFGASAGLIMGIDRALKAMVSSAIKVEKAMMDVNVVMGATTQQLEKFGKGMFRVAKETAQGFETVAEAATELARQGLGMEQTLIRTKDALILTRLTGMNAADSVKSLTAAVNSFNKEGVTSAQVINRMAKVDAKFAVSSEDLAKSISRVGASAVSAGVSMNELMAITTAVQQKTARGGAVIGNAFKTIFTRIQRSDVQQRLENIGVATRDMSGNMLSGIKIVENLSKSFSGLTKAQQSSVSEQVAGVFQVNILKAAMSDLSQANSIYAGALRASNSATDEAYQKNEKLNQTLDSLVNKTLANLTQAGAALGGGAFGPAIENILGTVNSIIDAFGDGGKLEKFGEGFGKDILTGIGKFIGGPGLIMATAVFAKLALSLGKFAKQALMDVVGINSATKQRAALEKAVVATIQSEPALLKQVEKGTLDIVSLEQRLLNTLKLQTAERAKMQAYARPIAGALYGRGARASDRGATYRGKPGRASGFVPNFANAGSERAAAAAGGYQAGAIKTMNQPGVGSMMYNSAETVKRFPGMSQSAIMPPQASPAGAGYSAAFGAAHGFDPYAAAGFVPNFGRAPVGGLKRIGGGVYAPTKGGTGGNKLGATARSRVMKMGGDLSVLGGLEGGISMLVPDGRPSEIGSFVQGTSPYNKFRASVPIRSYDKKFIANKLPKGPKDIIKAMKSAAAGVTMKFAKSIDPPARKIERDEVINALDSTKGAKGALTAAAGAGFEVGMNLSLDAKAAEEESSIGDFDVRGANAAKSHRVFGGKYSIADYKASRSGGNRSSMVNKMAKELIEGGPGARMMLHMPSKRKAALGFVPNFSPLTSAIGREVAAGVPASAIRVGSSPALKGAGNPGGVGVYNTIHEPAGLSQGISRSQISGIDPKMHGAATGFVPNFNPLATLAVKGGSKLLSGGKAGLGMGASMAGMGLMGQADGFGGRMLGATLAGGVGGLPGMAMSGGLQLLTEGLTLLMDTSGGAAENINKQNEANQELLNSAISAETSFGSLSKTLDEAAFRAKKIDVLKELGVKTGIAGAESTDSLMYGTPERRRLLASGNTKDEFSGALTSYRKSLAVRTATTQIPGVSSEFNEVRGNRVAKLENELSLYIKSLGDEVVRDSTTQKTIDAKRAQIERATTGDITGYGKLMGKSATDSLAGTDKFNLDKFYLERARTGGKPIDSDFKTSTIVNEEGFMAPKYDMRRSSGISAALGISESDARLMRGGAVKEMRALAPDASSAAIEQEVTRYFTILAERYNDEEKHNEILKTLNAEKDAEAKETAGYTDTIRKAMQEQEAYRQSVLESKRALQSLTRSVAQDQAKFGIKGGFRSARAAATMDRTGAAGVTRRVAIGRARLNREGAESVAGEALEVDIKEGLKGLDVLKTIEGSKMGSSQAESALEAFKGLRDAAATGGGQEKINSYINQLAGIKGLKLEKGVFSGEEGIKNQMKLGNLPKIIDVLTKASEKNTLTMDKAKDAEEDSIELAKLKHKMDLKSIKLLHSINTERQKEDRAIKASVADLRLKEAGRRMGEGQIGARGYSQAYSASLASDVDKRGVREGDFGRAFKAGFVNEMGYKPVDALQDWEQGTRSVAQNMKSSFADAFQSISSGANSVQGALANMAQSILNSISSMSTNMFTNMMFSKMGFSQGGAVPGYAAGGVVQGGSGYKDDVPTMMQGGEFVIKKSSAQKIGYGKLNAINGYAEGGPAKGGPSMGQLGLVAVGASALSGVIGSAMQPGAPKPLPSRDYGLGRGKHGFFGGADPDAGQGDMVTGGGGRAGVSLGKGFSYYRRDPETGRLISERSRPTEGRFEVSRGLSLMGRLGEDDPQTSRMFGKEQSMAKYQDYLATETASRKAQIDAVKRQKKQRLIGSYMNAAMMIGGAKFMTGGTPSGAEGGGIPGTIASPDLIGPRRADNSFANGGSASGSPAMVMGGEYIMSPETVRTHGANFMHELNRGNVPSYANGGPVGGTSAGNQGPHSETSIGGNTTNNVKISVNIDKTGKADASADTGSGGGGEREENEQANQSKEFGKILQGVVLDEIVKQQRPGGLLQANS